MSIYLFVIPVVLYNLILFTYQFVSTHNAVKKKVQLNERVLIVRRYMRLAKAFSLIGALFIIFLLSTLVSGNMSLSGLLGYNGVGFILYWGFTFHWFRILSAFKSWRVATKEIEDIKQEP